MEILIYLLSIVCFQYHPFFCHSMSTERVKVEADGGFTGIVIAIDPNITEQLSLINDIKELWTEASEALYIATNNLFYLKEIEIVVPIAWSSTSYDAADVVYHYEDADVIIEEENPSHGDEPYTVQYRPCGQYGSRIHLTPNFLTDKHKVPARQKSIVREWARLRWGVFDERGSDGNQFYYNRDQSLEATRCPEAIKGSFQSNVFSCQPESATGYPPEECKFIPTSKQDNITASIMSYYSIDKIVSFCQDNDSDLINKHNVEAPTDQNRYCNFRSTWSVISTSADYNKICSGQNPCSLPKPLTLKPNINVVKMKRIKTIALLVDIQYDVNHLPNIDNTGTKQQDVASACVQFVELYAPHDLRFSAFVFDQTMGLPFYRGIINKVDRNVQAKEMDRITSFRSLGSSSSSQVPPNTDHAVQLALKDIIGSSRTDDSEIIVITNGKGIWKKTEAQRTLSNDIRFSTVYMSDAVMPELDELTLKSGGRRAFAPDFITLHDYFVTLTADLISSEPYTRINIKRESIFAESGTTVEGSVLLDATARNETRFRFVYFCKKYFENVRNRKIHCQNVPKISVFSVSGKEYATPTEQTRKRIDFNFPGTAEEGKWRYVLKDNGVNDGGTGAVVLVSSISDPNETRITVRVRTSGSVVDHIDENPSFGMYAEVLKGSTRIFDAVVVADVSSPTGEKYSYRLFDNGAGADLRKDDGIYSAYFIDFYERGAYTITVTAVGKSIKESKKRSLRKPWNVVLKNGTNICIANCEGSASSITKRQAVDKSSFQRQKLCTQFQFIGQPLDKSADNFAPSRIADLKVEQLNVNDISDGLRYRFTAVGDDGMRGKALRYSFSYTSKGEYRDFVEDHKSFPVIPKEDIIQGDLQSPKEAGKSEEFVVSFPNIVYNKNKDNILRFGFSATAYDKMDRPSLVSNIVVIDIFLKQTSTQNLGTNTGGLQVVESAYEDENVNRSNDGGGRKKWADSDDGQFNLWLILIIFVVVWFLFIGVLLCVKVYLRRRSVHKPETAPRSSVPESDGNHGTTAVIWGNN